MSLFGGEGLTRPPRRNENENDQRGRKGPGLLAGVTSRPTKRESEEEISRGLCGQVFDAIFNDVKTRAANAVVRETSNALDDMTTGYNELRARRNPPQQPVEEQEQLPAGEERKGLPSGEPEEEQEVSGKRRINIDWQGVGEKVTHGAQTGAEAVGKAAAWTVKLGMLIGDEAGSRIGDFKRKLELRASMRKAEQTKKNSVKEGPQVIEIGKDGAVSFVEEEDKT